MKRPRGVARVGSTALLAQVVSSSSNFLINVVVVRLLGVTELGRFSLMFSALLILVALQTSWVGDSLVVLARSEPAIKRGIDATQWGFTLIGSAAAGLSAGAVGAGLSEAIAFAVLAGLWVLEEYGRRMFMARMEFGRLAVNDAVYLLLTAAALIGVELWGVTTLTSIMLCMAGGAGAAFLAGMVTLPPLDRLWIFRPSRSEVGSVAGFGVWRSAQSGLGMLGGFLVRVVVVTTGSAAMLGELEVGRLVVAPLFVLIASSSNVLLPLFAEKRDDHARVAELSRMAVTGLGGVTLVYGLVVLVMADTSVQMVGGASAHSGRVVILGWLLQALTVGTTNPMFASALVRGLSAVVFWTKAAGMATSIFAAWLLMSTSGPRLVPMSLAAGLVVAAFLLWRVDKGSDVPPAELAGLL